MTLELVNPVMRPVPKEWEQELAAFSPQTNRMSWLKLIWEQGYPWEPVERYMIYQMTPARFLTSPFEKEILAELEHPKSPAERGNYFDKELGEFIRRPDCNITERAYHLFRETGAWGRPYWVIQGSTGGHKRWFNQVEQKLLRIRNLPPHPPAPGDLPFAEFDQRVMAHLRKHDLLSGRHAGLKNRGRILHGAHSSRHQAELRECREELIAWLTEQVAEVAPEAHRALKALDQRKGRISGESAASMDRRAEQAVENYIETGNSHGGADPRRFNQ